MIERVRVLARQPTNDAGPIVRAGEPLYIRAEGVWWDAVIPTDPNGYRAPLLKLLGIRQAVPDGDRFLRLWGRIDPTKQGETPQTFPIGRNTKHTAAVAGRLSLFANDRRGAPRTAWGAVTAWISNHPMPDVAARGWWSTLRELAARTHGIPPIIAILSLAAVVLTFTRVGRDIVTFVTDSPEQTPWQIVFLYVTAYVLGLQGWFWARTIVSSNYGPDPAGWRPHWLLSWGPRVLAMFPLSIAGAGLAIHDVAERAPVGEFVWSGACFALALTMIPLLWLRRAYLGVGGRKGRLKPAARAALGDRAGLVAILLTVVVAVAMSVEVILHPVPVAQGLGPPAVVFLSMALIIPVVAGAANLVRVTRFPITMVVLCVIVAISAWTDNHEVGVRAVGPDRNGPAPAADHRPTLAQAVDLWWAANRAHPSAVDADGVRTYPIIFVAAQGGASRAGFWTGLVLSRLQQATAHLDPGERFSDRLFAISSVSGSNLGAAAFIAAVQDPRTAAVPEPLVTRFTGSDFLSPALAGLLFPDLQQRLIPTSWRRLPDRAETLERGWQQGWTAACAQAPGCARPRLFAEPFLSLWPQLGPAAAGQRAPRAWTPLLFINGTGEESGRRVITAPVRFTGDDIPAADDFRDLAGRDVRLSTAALNGARFPVISPAGRIDIGRVFRGHVLDGGYYEGIGDETLLDLLRATLARFPPPSGAPIALRPIIVEITNSGADDDAANPKDGFVTHVDSMAPLLGLLATRDGHSTTVAAHLARLGTPAGWATANGVTVLEPTRVQVPLIVPPSRELPLDWVLSGKAQAAALDAIRPGTRAAAGVRAVGTALRP